MPTEPVTIGKSEIRKDAWAKAAGTALYTADIPLKGVKAVAVVRSPHHHARFLAIDPNAAQTLPGVLAVITSSDFPVAAGTPGGKTIGAIVPDRPPLANGVVRFIGEPVALVVAETLEQARRGAAAVQVEYERLPAVFDPLAALQPDSPLVHPGGNLLTEYDVTGGDLQAGFAAAEIILEETFTTPRAAPAYLEPEVAMATWAAPQSGEAPLGPGALPAPLAPGQVTGESVLWVWVSSQKPFADAKDIAYVLDLPVERVRAISAVIGGAFGGREDSSISVLAALAAWKTGHPVRLVNTRHESFTGHPKRHPAHLRLKLGATREGRLTALEATVHLDPGAYASYGPAIGGLLTEVVPVAYNIPNVRVNTRVVYTNTPICGAMRGFGAPQAHFATESLMDMLAQRLALDPVELRQRNVLKPGDRMFTGVIAGGATAGLPAILDHAAAAMQRLRAVPPAGGRRAGVGIAMLAQSMGYGHGLPDDSTNGLEWLPDGRVLVHLGAPELGQGLQTAAEQMTAEFLGLPYASIVTAGLDTHIVPDGGVTCASRMTYIVGNSLQEASHLLVDELLDYAAETTRQLRAGLRYAAGQVILPDGRQVNACDLAARAAEAGVRLKAQATFSFPYPSETTPQHLPIGMPHVMFGYGAQVARVEMDPELGTVEVTDVVAIHDVGRIINRLGAESQIEGGVVMGMGYALLEDMGLKSDGRWVDSFTEYLLPTSLDAPHRIQSILLETPEESGPFGARGIAEMCLSPPAPAIANAVCNATGRRARSIPIRPEMLVIDE